MKIGLIEKFRALKKPDPAAEESLRNEIEEFGGLEKNDMLAMIISAMLVILPIAAIILLVFAAFAWLFM